MERGALLKMVKARSRLVLEHPFFASLLLRLDMRPDPACSGAWSDGRFLAYNPAYVECLPLEKVMGLQCHTVLHLACGHHLRRGDRDGKLWNRACDYAINPILIEAGLQLPDGYLDDPAYHGKSAESIYARLAEIDREANDGAGQGLSERETEAEEGLEGEARSRDGGDEDEAVDSLSRSEAEDSGNRGSEAGEAGDGPEDDRSEDGGDAGLTGEVRDASSPPGGGEDSDPGGERDDWRMAAASALARSGLSGDVPGSLARLVLEAATPSMPWREVLRVFLSKAARNDFSWVRPNRRSLHLGVYLPGLESLDMADVAVAVDTSGSISQQDLDAFAGELSGVLEELETRVHVMTCDAAVTSLECLDMWDLPLRFKARGGGGTDFRPPFKRLAEEGTLPDCLVYFTDMVCNSFPEDPGYPVLWVTPNHHHPAPPFGEVLLMDAEE